jgi:hypothetical protein
MIDLINELFEDKEFIKVMQTYTSPRMYLYNKEFSRNDEQVGMEVGVIREKFIVSMIHSFHPDKVNRNIRINAGGIDVEITGIPADVKTLTTSYKAKTFQSVKTGWTVDEELANEFIQNYYPTEEIIFLSIIWSNCDHIGHLADDKGGLYYIPLEAMIEEFAWSKKYGQPFLEAPKKGKNSRGIVYTGKTMNRLVNNPLTKKIHICFYPFETDFNGYTRTDKDCELIRSGKYSVEDLIGIWTRIYN